MSLSVSSSNRAPQFGFSLPRLVGDSVPGATAQQTFQEIKDELGIIKKAQGEQAKQGKKTKSISAAGLSFSVFNFLILLFDQGSKHLPQKR